MTAAHARLRVLTALATTVGALGVTAMLSTAAAPAAHADDLVELLDSLDADFVQGSATFSSALSDFGSDNISQGLGQLVDAFDDYTLSPGVTIAEGLSQALVGIPVNASPDWTVAVPNDFSDGLTLAESYFSAGGSDLAAGVAALASADYLDAASGISYGLDYLTAVPLEEVLLGTLVSF